MQGCVFSTTEPQLSFGFHGSPGPEGHKIIEMIYESLGQRGT